MTDLQKDIEELEIIASVKPMDYSDSNCDFCVDNYRAGVVDGNNSFANKALSIISQLQEEIKILKGGVMSEWKPISSAPKTGEKILLSNLRIAQWGFIDKIHLNSYNFPEQVKGKKFWLDEYGDAMNFCGKNPTHWCELPKPNYEVE